ncbi:hypothetical protein BMJ29_21815 [Sinorhizobium medicae]|nr:hypothetical protein BMJ29_21815 [Sinorhizobium medicae]
MAIRPLTHRPAKSRIDSFGVENILRTRRARLRALPRPEANVATLIEEDQPCPISLNRNTNGGRLG